MPFIIDKIKVLKSGFQITINQQILTCDEYLYKTLYPYESKELDKKQYALLSAFSNAFEILKRNYKKIYNHELSCYDFRQLLIKNDINEEDIILIMQQLKIDGYLNDFDFVNRFKPIYEKDKGINAFKTFLYSHRIHSSVSNPAIEDYHENEEYIKNYIAKQIKQNKQSSRMLQFKIKQSLLQKGFSETIISCCLNQTNWEDDLENLKRDYQRLLQKDKKNKYKIISKLVNKGYNVNMVKKIVGNEEVDYE